jgi:long-subunit fatty acid transport protein
MLRSSIVVLLIAFSASVSAEDFDYNYFSLGYGIIDFDNVNADGDGFNLGGSYAINESFHVFADYSSANLDNNIDATGFGAGIGWHTSLSDVVDLVAGLSYEYVEIDVPGIGNPDDNGLGLGVGLRFAASDVLELNAGIEYVDLSDSGSDTGFGVGGLYDVTDAFSIGLGGNWSDDASSYTLSGRFYFGE